MPTTQELFSRIVPCDMERPFAFVSYGSDDAREVYEDVLELQRLGYNVWLDNKNLDKTSPSWRTQAQSVISSVNCAVVVFFASFDSLTSGPCLAEMRQTRSEKAVRRHRRRPVPVVCVSLTGAGDVRQVVDAIDEQVRASSLPLAQKNNRIDVLYAFEKEFFDGDGVEWVGAEGEEGRSDALARSLAGHLVADPSLTGGRATLRQDSPVEERIVSQDQGGSDKPTHALTRRQLVAIGAGAAACAAVGAAAVLLGGTQDEAPLPLEEAYAVLYADGELVFQRGEATDEGREVLHAEAVDVSDPWWAGKQLRDDEGTGTGAFEGEWRGLVKRISSSAPVVLPDLAAARSAGASDEYKPGGFFEHCINLVDVTGLANWDVTGAGSLDYLFQGCASLADVSPLAGWDVSDASGFSHMFNGCEALADLSPLAGWDVSGATDLSHMFSSCDVLADLSPLAGWDVSGATDLGKMFSFCEALTGVSGLEGWDVSGADDLGDMFSYCYALADLSSLEGWDVSGATDLSQMFTLCSALTDVAPLAGWDVSGATDLSKMFAFCTSLQDASALSGWSLNAEADVSDMFYQCPAKTPTWYEE